MEERYARQLKKGVLELIVLQLATAKPVYGYELLSAIKEKSNGMLALKEGTLYPILYRLEDEGMIKARWQSGEGRNAPKKYYEATEKGHLALCEMQDTWFALSACVESFIVEEDKHD
ncbi:MAG: PadR family transcriptional regulator [Oscillospiraceae bacterium]